MIPAHHTESKMSAATQGRIAFWRLQRNSINQSWIIVRRSRAIHRGVKGNTRQTALVRTLSRVATSIRMTELGYERAESADHDQHGLFRVCAGKW
jgi:hypothetical protein